MAAYSVRLVLTTLLTLADFRSRKRKKMETTKRMKKKVALSRLIRLDEEKDQNDGAAQEFDYFEKVEVEKTYRQNMLNCKISCPSTKRRIRIVFVFHQVCIATSKNYGQSQTLLLSTIDSPDISNHFVLAKRSFLSQATLMFRRIEVFN